MTRKLGGALCATLAVLGISVAQADVWIVRDAALERRNENGALVSTISEAFGEPLGDRVRQGEVDRATGNIWLALQNLEDRGPEPLVSVVGLKPNGDEIWKLSERGVGFIEPSFAIDSGRYGIWVLRAVGAQYNDNLEAVLYDQSTGQRLARVRGLGRAFRLVVAADGAIWVAAVKGTGSKWIRLQGTTAQLDGYQVVGAVGPHHRAFPTILMGDGLAADPNDGGIYFSLSTADSSTESGDLIIVKYSAQGQELFRRPYPWIRYMRYTDFEVDPLDSSLYFTASHDGAFIGRVSPLGAELDTTGFAEHNDSLAIDPEDDSVWVAEMPRVDDDLALIAPMNLRKLDKSLQSLLAIAFDEVIRIVGAAPAPTTLEVSIDVQPQRNDNLVNLGSTEVRVALLSSASFDPLQVDSSTVRFGTAGAVVRWYWTRDVNGDALADLVAVFRTQDTGIKCGDTFAPLVGTTFGGLTVRGSGALLTQCP